MSKSTGNIVDPFALADKYGAEALRYYLMRGIATGSDADFSEQLLVNTYNNDLSNVLGNLLNRTLTMVWRYSDGSVRLLNLKDLCDRPDWLEVRKLVQTEIPNSFDIYAQEMSTFNPAKALGMLVFRGLCGNAIVEITAPWKLAKQESEKNRLHAVLYYLTDLLRIIAVLISPVLPKAAHGIFDQLNWKMDLSGKEERFSLADAEWGELPDGHVVGKPVPLFPRIES